MPDMEGGQAHCTRCGARISRDVKFCGECGSSVIDESTQLRHVGRFALGPIVGHGGMGVVHRAHDSALGRDVALKLIAPSLADDAAFRARFEAEARAAAAVDHPNVLPLFEAGEDDGELYLAMRLVEGTDLKAVLTRESRLSGTRTARIVAQIAAALDAAHARGLVHRDVKPANALIDGEGEEEHVYLTDFGLTIAGADGQLTNPGQIVGTANYIAPEQIDGGEMDGRVDVYALACVAFECLTGEPPFARATVAATLSAHLHDEIPAATSRNGDLRRDVDDALAAGLAKDPAQRFASCGALARALGAALGTDTGVVPSDPAVALRARPRTPPPTARARGARAEAPTAVMDPQPRRTSHRRGAAVARLLAGLAGIAALGALATAAVIFLPSLLGSGEGNAGADRTIETLSGASAVNTNLSSLISSLARDPTSELEREDQRRRLPALRAEVSQLRSTAASGTIDPAVRSLLLGSLRAQEELLNQYGEVLSADPADAQPLIEAMSATLSQVEADLAEARGP